MMHSLFTVASFCFALLSNQVGAQTPLCATNTGQGSSKVFLKQPQLYKTLTQKLAERYPRISAMEILVDRSYVRSDGAITANLIFTEVPSEHEFQRLKVQCTHSPSSQSWDCNIVAPYSNFSYRGRVVYFEGISAGEAKSIVDAFGQLTFKEFADSYPEIYQLPVEVLGCIGSVSKSDEELFVTLGGSYGSLTFQLVERECGENICPYRPVYRGSSNPD